MLLILNCIDYNNGQNKKYNNLEYSKKYTEKKKKSQMFIII